MHLMPPNAAPGQALPDFNLNAAIELIYASSSDSTAWRKVANMLARMFDVDAVVLCHTEGDSVRILGEGLFNLTAEDAARLPLSYRATNLPSAHHSGNGAVRTVDDAGFAREIDRLHPGARVLTVVIPEFDRTEPLHATHLSVARADGRLPFSSGQQNLRMTLSKHLTEAVRIHRRFVRIKRTAKFNGLAILHLGEAWLVLDRSHALVECSPLARSFLMRSDLMRLTGGKVVFPTADTEAALTEAMSMVWSGESDREQVSVTSPEDGAQVGFDIIPAHSSEHRSGDEPDGIMVLVREVDRELMLKVEAKAEACRLSRAERRVMVQLVRSGQPPATIATALGISERTVRCQLSSIFRKTGARNQQDLIRMTLAG